MRYVLDFGSANAGGSPTFSLFARLDTLAALTPPSIVEIAEGEYYFDYNWTTAPSGVTSIAYKAVIDATEVSGTISGSSLPASSDTPPAGGLTSLAAVKAYLGNASEITNPLSATDALLTDLIVRVSTWMRRQVGCYIESASYTETIVHDGSDCIIPRQTPVTAITSITADGVAIPDSTAWDVAGRYVLNGMIWLRNWYVPDRSVISLTYTAGYATIPADIEQAVIEMVALKFKEAPHIGIQNANSTSFGMSATFLPSIVPQSVRDVIEGYRRVSA